MARTARLELVVDGKGAKRGASEADRELQQLKKTAKETVNDLRELGKGADKAGKEAGGASREFDRMGKSADRAGDSFLRARVGAGGLSSSLVALRNAAIVVIGLQLGKAFLDVADKSKQMDATLRLAIGTTTAFATAQADVRRIAMETRGGLEETSDLYSKVTRITNEMGKTHEDAARFTETFAKTLKISGATTDEAANATKQFGQALQSGVLRGDEFNSMMESAPRLSRLLADSLGVPIGSLRQMAAEGELTADKLYKAMTDTKFTEGIDAEFKTLPLTFDDAMTLVKDKATILFGEFDKGGGFSNMLIEFMGTGSDVMETLSGEAQDFGITVRATLEGLGAAFEPFYNAGVAVFNALGVKTYTLRDEIGSLLGALDDIANGANFGRGTAEKWIDKNVWGLSDEPANSRGRFEQRFDEAQRRGQIDRQDRDFADLIPGGSFRPGDASNFVAGIGRYAPRSPAAPAAGGDKKDDDKSSGRTESRSNRQILDDFTKELHRLGVGTVPGAVRTASHQNSLYKQGLTELDGYTGISRHQNAQAIDFNRATFDEGKVRQAAAAAGIKGLEIVTESGGRKHAEWTGGGKKGDLSDQLNEQERAAKALADAAERRAEREAELYATLENQAKVAALLPAEAEQLNEELKLRAIINDGLKSGDKEITDAQRQRIKDALAERNMAEALGRIREDSRAAQFETIRLQDRARVLSESTLDTEEDNLALQERMWPYKLEALDKGLNLQDDTLKAVLAELEARERTNIALERKEKLIRDGMGVADRFKTPGMLQADDLRAIGKDREALEAARAAGKVGDDLYAAATKGLDQAVYEVSNRFQFEMVDSIVNLAGEFEGKFGSVIQKVANVLSVAAAQAKGDFSQSGPIGGIIGLFNGPGGNPVADAATKASQNTLKELTSGSAFKNPIGSLAKGFGDFKGDLKNLFGKGGDFSKGLGSVLGKAGMGAQMGTAADGIMKALGIKSSKTGAQISGAVGSAVGGPIGGLIGSIGGGLIGGLFKKTPTGSVSINQGGINTGGKLGDTLKGSGNSVTAALNQIADQLGAELGAFSVAIGKRKDEFRVSASGNAAGTTKKGSKLNSSDIIYRGEDEDAAVRAAIANAIKDGAIKGLAPVIQRAVQNAGADFEKGLSDALKLKSVFDEFKRMTDPVGFALEELNKGFQDIVDIMRSAGGSAEEFAQAERVYQKQRADIIENGNNASLKEMRDYLFQLRGGTSSVLSPELRYNNAKAELDRLDATRASGGDVDFSQYKSTADAFLAASRDAKGSTLGFFSDLDRVTGTVQSLIDLQKAPTVNTPPVDFTPVVGALSTQTQILGDYLAQIAAGMASGGGQAVVSGGASRVSVSSPRYAQYNL